MSSPESGSVLTNWKEALENNTEGVGDVVNDVVALPVIGFLYIFGLYASSYRQESGGGGGGHH